MGPGSVGMGLLAGAHHVPRRASSAIFSHLPRSPIHIAQAVGCPRSRLHPRDTSMVSVCTQACVWSQAGSEVTTPHQPPGAFEVAWSSPVSFWTMELGS